MKIMMVIMVIEEEEFNHPIDNFNNFILFVHSFEHLNYQRVR